MAHFRPGWGDWPPALLDFWTERHLCLLTTLKRDGRPHVVPVGAALDHDERCAWVITDAASAKARHLSTPGGPSPAPVAVGQVEGRHWATLEGTATVHADPTSVARAEQQYAARYRTPRINPTRVALRIEVQRVLCSAGLV